MPIFRVFLSAENDTGAHALDWFKNSAKFYRILLFRHEQGWGQLLATSKGLLTFGDDYLSLYIIVSHLVLLLLIALPVDDHIVSFIV
jgi:hypothetical protein